MSLEYKWRNYYCNAFVFTFKAFSFYFFSYFILASASTDFIVAPYCVCLSLFNLASIMDFDWIPIATGLFAFTCWYYVIGTRGEYSKLSSPFSSKSKVTFLSIRILDLIFMNYSYGSIAKLWESLYFLSSSYLLIWLSSSLMPERSSLQLISDLVLERYSWYKDGALLMGFLVPSVDFIRMNKILLY